MNRESAGSHGILAGVVLRSCSNFFAENVFGIPESFWRAGSIDGHVFGSFLLELHVEKPELPFPTLDRFPQVVQLLPFLWVSVAELLPVIVRVFLHDSFGFGGDLVSLA